MATKWTYDRAEKHHVATGRHTRAVVSHGNPGWGVEVVCNFGNRGFLDAEGTIYLPDAKFLAEELMAKWDREIDRQGGPSAWR